jgi:zinc transport system permease protein
MDSILSLPFFQNALLIGVLASIACGIIGSYVVVKKISFISGSIAHSAFGGIGLSYFFGLNPLLGATAFGLGAAMLMGSIRYKFKQQEDTLIGAIWALGMAIGILFIHYSAGYASDLFGYLFGNILLASRTECLLILLLDVVILGSVFLFYHALQAITFDEEYAKVINLPVFALYLFLLALIAITVVILIRVVGVILVIALLTLPAAAARNFTMNMKSLQFLAVIFGILSTTTGLFIAYFLDVPSGPVIIILSTAIYLISFLKFKFA